MLETQHLHYQRLMIQELVLQLQEQVVLFGINLQVLILMMQVLLQVVLEIA